MIGAAFFGYRRPDNPMSDHPSTSPSFVALILLAAALGSQEPIRAPMSSEVAELLEQSVWRVAGSNGDFAGSFAPILVGNGRVAAATATGPSASSLAAIVGPHYGAGDPNAVGQGTFGSLAVELIDEAGNPRRIHGIAAARVVDAPIAVSEDLSGSVALRSTLFPDATAARLTLVLDVESLDGTSLRGRGVRVTPSSPSTAIDDRLRLESRWAVAELRLSGARVDGSALRIDFGDATKWQGVLEIETGTGDGVTLRPSPDRATLANELREVLTQWRQRVARGPKVDTDHRRLLDLYREQRLQLLIQRCASTGAIVPLLGVREIDLWTQVHATIGLLRVGFVAEAKGVIELVHESVRRHGAIRTSYPLSPNPAVAATPIDSIDGWRTMAMPAGGLPSMLLLQHYWYWRATRDVTPVESHWLLLDACLKRVVRGTDSMIEFVGDEPECPTAFHRAYPDALGDDPRLFGLGDERSRPYSFANGVRFLLSLQAWGEMADARDVLARPDEWKAGTPSDAPSRGAMERMVAILGDIERRFWIEDLGRFAAAVSAVDGSPVREAFAPANLFPLWIGWTYPTGEKSRDNLASSLRGLWLDGVRVGSTRNLALARGEAIGMLLVAASERDDKRRMEVFDEVLRQAEPVATFSEWRSAEGRALGVAADPAVGAINLDALMFGMLGVRTVAVPSWDDDDIRLELRLPKDAQYLSVRNLTKDARTLDVFVRRSVAPMTEEERRANDLEPDERRRDPTQPQERLHFVVELIDGNPKDGYYHADIDALGTMFVRFLRKDPPKAEGEPDLRRIEEFQYSTPDRLEFLPDRSGPGDPPGPRRMPDDLLTTHTLLLTARESLAKLAHGEGVIVMDSRAPLAIRDLEALLLDGEKRRIARLVLDHGFDPRPPASWNGALWRSNAWQTLLERYQRGGGKVGDLEFVRRVLVDGVELSAAADGAIVLPPGPNAAVIEVPLPASRPRVIRTLHVGTNVALLVLSGERVLLDAKAQVPSAPDGHAIVLAEDTTDSLRIEVSAEPTTERRVFLRFAGGDGLPLR
ncbi:MAG: hypothetical protein AB7I19_03700 [Planctomycetota bacterium]